jgi:hypothetical protein
MNKYIIFAVITCTTLYFDAQNLGFMGKKNLIELNVITYAPLLANSDFLFTPANYYVNEGGYLVDKTPRVKFAYSLNVIRSLSNKVAFGIEIGRQQLHLATNEYYSRRINGDFITVKGELENLDANHFFFIPKFEFSRSSGIFGNGMSNQLGLGFGRTTFIEKDYLFNFRHTNGNTSSNLTDAEKQDFKDHFYDYSHAKYKNLIFLYALNFRRGIAKNLSLNYGFRYTLNFRFRNSTTLIDDENYWVNRESFMARLRVESMSNLVQFKIGLTYFF